MLEFDPIRLNPVERKAWTRFVETAGPRAAASMFELMVCWVLGLVNDGKTPSEVREIVIGKFYDNVTLMHRGQAMRNETIILAKAMVEQALSARSRIDALGADILLAARQKGN